MRGHIAKRILAGALAFLLFFALAPVLGQWGGLVPDTAATVSLTNVDAVLIYNPLLYRETWVGSTLQKTPNTLYTGSLAGSGVFSLGAQDTPFALAQELPQPLSDHAAPYCDVPFAAAQFAGGTGDTLFATYRVGDKKTFWIQTDLDKDSTNARRETTCRAVGSHCYVWVIGANPDASLAAKMAQEFDTKIYPKLTDAFGSARFMESGEKLNILCYTITSGGRTDSLSGFFYSPELLTAAEMGAARAQYYNTGSPIIHINAYYCYETQTASVFSTLAHEFAHLITYTSALKNAGNTSRLSIDTWLNESLSMQAAELIYPGAAHQERYIDRYNTSWNVRAGTSLYCVDYDGDAGVYGQLALFSEYLKAQAGSGSVFKNIHSTVRLSPATNLRDANAIAAALPQSAIAAASNSVIYPDEVTKAIGNANEILLSKLNLNFQISIIEKAASGIYSRGTAYAGAVPPRYTSTSGAHIQGGGRIYLRVNGRYDIPADADPKLIYVGFKDGKLSILPTTAANYTGPIVTPSPSPTPQPTPVPTPCPTRNPDGSVQYGDA
ncbi:MAG: hypothetical protein FWE69_06615, partial [Clostridiales bacterium]|nr:hypothetical protein [Clostridiales bacterium]